MGCMTSEVPEKFKIILFSFIDPKYEIERLYFKTLMVRSRIHLLLNTILGTEYTAVKKSQKFLTSGSLLSNGVWVWKTNDKQNYSNRKYPKKVGRGQQVAKLIGQHHSGSIRLLGHWCHSMGLRTILTVTP